MSMSRMKITLECVGPKRGQTFTFRNYEFDKGRITLEGSPEQVIGAATYLERTMQAFPVGSDELAAMIKKLHPQELANSKEAPDGDGQVHPGAGGGEGAAVRGGVPPISQPPAGAPAGVGGANAGAPTDPPALVPNGNGQGGTGSGDAPATAAPAAAGLKSKNK